MQYKLNWNEIKHLRFTASLSDITLNSLKEHVYRILRDQDKDSLYQEFIDWKRSDNEIMLYSDYSLISFDLPIHFDTIIQADQPDVVINANVIVPFCILNGWAAIKKVEMGHRHVCLLRFDGRIPEVLKMLPDVNDTNGNHQPIILFNKADTDH